MKRPVVTILLALACHAGAGFCAAQSVSNREAVSWTKVSRSEWQLEFHLPQLHIDSLTLSSTQWADCRADGMANLASPGLPALPFEPIWIPAEVTTADFELVGQQSHQIECAPPLPAPQPVNRSVLPSLTYLPDESAYSSSAPIPGQLIEVVQTGDLGKSALTQVCIHPVQYTAASNTLVIYDELRFRVTLSPGQSLDNSNLHTPYAPQLISDLVQLQQPFTPPQEVISPRLWIVTSPEYVDAMTEWREFKRTIGIPSEVIVYADVATNSASLKTYLQQRYEQVDTPAEYLLLVGDHQDIPGFYGVGSSLTDHPYGCLSGSDFLPDISVGRLPVRSVTQLETWLARALSYERDGNVGASPEATVFSSSVALDPQHGAHVGSVFTHAGLNSTALQQPQSGALPLLIGSLNEQPLWTFYIGHGNSQSWSSVAPHFTAASLPQIQDSRPGIVVSVACATADFDETENSIAENWTLNMLSGGSLCYIGATESTAFFYSDTIGLATVEAVFEHDYSSIGKALDYGKLRCAEFFPQQSGGLTEETIQQFILFGDPSLRPFTSLPVVAGVDIPEVLPIGSTHVPVSVLYNSAPIPGAVVTLCGESEAPRVVTTDGEGFALVPLPVTSEHQWMVTVTGTNMIPVQRTVIVAPVAGPILQLQTVELDESIGDADDLPDRGESGSLRVLIHNAGTSQSQTGLLRLESSNAAVSISPSLLNLPEIPAQSEDWLDAVASYSIAGSAEQGTTVQIRAWLGDGQNATYAGSYSFTLNSPRIEMLSQSLAELSGNGNGLPDAGEQLELRLVLTNRGNEPLRSPIVDCAPDHNYLHIQHTRWEAASVDAGATDTVTFVFTCDSITPRGFAFEYSAILSSVNDSDREFWGHYRIGRIPLLLYVLDSNPQQLPAVEGALQVLGIEYQSTTILPPDLSPYASIWVFCGIHPNQEPLPPQSAQRIADYLDDGGSCYWEGGDVWAFDYPTVLHPYFGIEGVSDGLGDAGPISGIQGQVTEGMAFAYGGENSFIDRIRAQGSAFELLSNSRNGAQYSVSVANSGPSYRTVGSSIEIGALQDSEAPSTRVHLVKSILDWFRIPSLHDLTPPVITHVPMGVWYNAHVPIPIFADVQDESELDYVACDYRVNGGSLESLNMQPGSNSYVTQLPVLPLGSQITYRLRAADRSTPQNTTVTDEYQLSIENYSDRIVDLIPGSESLPWCRKRGSNGKLALARSGENFSVVLMGDAAGKVSTFVTEPLDLSTFAMPELVFCSVLSGKNSEDPVAARIYASTDGGKSFPYLVWRAGFSVGEQRNLIKESDLTSLGGQPSVVFKFVYYADSYWEISGPQIRESEVESKPVRNLVVAPGEIISLHWAPAGISPTTYRILAAPTLRDIFVPIASTSDTFFRDQESLVQSQRFYKVEEVRTAGLRSTCESANAPLFDRVGNSFKRRSE